MCQPFLDKPLSNAEPAFGLDSDSGSGCVCLASQFSCVVEPEEKTPYQIHNPEQLQSRPSRESGGHQFGLQVIEKEIEIYCEIICTFTQCHCQSLDNCFT